MIEVKELFEDIYAYDNGRVRAFLIKGENEDLLIDTLFKEDKLIPMIKREDRSLKVVLTHSDRDHIGGLDEEVKECYIHLYDAADIKTTKVITIKEGDHISCGRYDFIVIHIPGHTKGSIALFDKEKGILISGDSIQKGGPIYMFGEHRDLDAYIASLKKLKNIKNDIKVILPSHHDCPIDPSYIEKDLEDILALKEGRLRHEKTPNMPCDTYHGTYVDYYYIEN